MQYCMVFYTYSGMPIPIIPAYAPEDSKVVRKECALYIRRARKLGRYVKRIKHLPGEVARWEVQTPPDAVIISDCEGILVVEQVSTGDEANTFDDEAYDDA